MCACRSSRSCMARPWCLSVLASPGGDLITRDGEMISSLRGDDGWGSQGVADFESTVSATDRGPVPPLLTVLLRRWRAVGLTLLAWFVVAFLYLALTPCVYRAAASIHVLQSGQHLLGEEPSGMTRSEGFVGRPPSAAGGRARRMIRPSSPS